MFRLLSRARVLAANFATLSFHSGYQFRRAGVALAVGLAAPAMIGATGFAVDAAFWVAQHTALQTATDAAAMKAARDLETQPGTTPAILNSDALAAANAASSNQFQFSSFTVTQLAETRDVQVRAAITGPQFFSHAAHLLPVAISASSTAGAGYGLISSQASCYSVDSYSYLFSTGLGAIDTAHSSGVDSYKCGASSPAPPPAYNAFCANGASANGGLFGCNLDLLNLSPALLPFAITIGPNPPTGFTNFNGVVAPVLATVAQFDSLLSGFSGAGQASMTVLSNGAAMQNISAGVYNGGLTIPAGATANFGAGTYDIENGDLVISTMATVSSNGAIFYFGGTTPGGLVEATQLQFNTAPIDRGAIVVTSATVFRSNSMVGTQTSAPISAYPYIESYEAGQGLLPSVSISQGPGALSFLGMPAGNLAGTNFVSVLATCPQATSTCGADKISVQTPPVRQATVIPSLSGIAMSTLISLAGLGNIPVIALLTSNEGESSTTTITSAATIANGVPTDWSQTESANSNLTNATQNLSGVLSYLGLPGTLLLDGAINTVMTLLTTIGVQLPASSTPTYSNTGLFAGQTSVAPASGASCTGQNSLYSRTVTPGFSPSFSDVLDSGGANNANGVNGAMTVTDTINVCGTTLAGIASVAPINGSTSIVGSTAAGSTTVMLLP